MTKTVSLLPVCLFIRGDDIVSVTLNVSALRISYCGVEDGTATREKSIGRAKADRVGQYSGHPDAGDGIGETEGL